MDSVTYCRPEGVVERHVTDLHGNPVSDVAAPGVASPAAGQLSAADPAA